MSDASANSRASVQRHAASAERWSHPRDRFEHELPDVLLEKLADLDRAVASGLNDRLGGRTAD